MISRSSNLVHSIPIRVWLSPPGRVLVITVVAWLFTFAVCSNKLWREPHSAFFDGSDRQYEFKYSTARAQQGLQHLEKLETQGERSGERNIHPEICTAFVTVKREGIQYVDAAVGSMLQGLTKMERSQIDLKLLFADSDPREHPTWKQPWLWDAVDWAGTYNATVEDLESLDEMRGDQRWTEKGVLDYLYALSLCYYESTAPYILILEDDIILADTWLAKTLHALHTIASKSSRPTHPFYNFLYLRLFYSETFLAWDANFDFMYRRMDVVFLTSISAAFLTLLITRRLFPSTKRHLPALSILTLSLLTIPAFLILLFMAGKNALTPNGVVAMPHQGCCTQALLFPRHHVPALTQWFRHWKDPSGRDRPYDNHDLMIDYYAREKGLPMLALRPQVVQHVGVKSSRGSGDEAGRSMRAFWFEDYEAGTLRREHERLTGEEES